jgi:hypothetical protein
LDFFSEIKIRIIFIFYTKIPIKNKKEIHRFLDWGFEKSTKIKLSNGTSVNINEICINDVLENGEKVYGIVEIDGLDIKGNYLYNLGKNNIEGYIPYPYISGKELQRSNNLYHLLTDNKTFKLGDIIISDYNKAIDSFLEM